MKNYNQTSEFENHIILLFGNKLSKPSNIAKAQLANLKSLTKFLGIPTHILLNSSSKNLRKYQFKLLDFACISKQRKAELTTFAILQDYVRTKKLGLTSNIQIVEKTTTILDISSPKSTKDKISYRTKIKNTFTKTTSGVNETYKTILYHVTITICRLVPLDLRSNNILLLG